jgi:beta-lactamase regulating signal transducer with metallopeptidase domain
MNAMLESAVVWLLWTGLWWVIPALGLALWFRIKPPQTAAVRHAALAAAIVAGTLAGWIPRWGNGVVTLPESVVAAPGDTLPEPIVVKVAQDAPRASFPNPPPSANGESRAVPATDAQTPAADARVPAVIPITPSWDWLMFGKNLITAAWVLGVLILSVRLFRAARMTFRWRREATSLPDDEQAMFVALKKELRIHRATHAASHTEPASPVVLCGWPPLVLVPSDWLTWDPEARCAAWRHELAHVRRCDDWWRMLSEGLRILWWFHPAVHWLLSRREHEAELLSDEAAVAAGCPPQELAQVLLNACRRPQTTVWTAPAGTFFSLRTMKVRISRLLEAPSAEALCRPAPRGLRLAAFAAMTLLALAGSMRWITAVHAATPADLAMIERKISKEPQYLGQPMYCLLMFGKNAEPRWLVLDNVTEPNTNGPGENIAYFDRDGDGDLTKPGNRIVGKIERSPMVFQPVQLPEFQNPVFNIGDVVLADGTRHTEFVVSLHDYLRDHRHVELSMKRRGKHWQGTHAPESMLLRLGATPQAAPVVHFDGPIELYPNPIGWSGPACPHPRGTPEFEAWCRTNPSVYKRKWMVSGTSFQMEAVIGTPGSGAGSFVRLARSAVPNDADPHAAIVLPNGRKIEADLDVKHFETLETLYRAEIAIPANTPPGKAVVTVSFPGWPEGPAPATDEIEVEAATVAVAVPPAKIADPDEPMAAPAMKTNYFTVIGKLVDAETGKPIEKASWEWGMADPKQPGQIAWGHSRQYGGSYPKGNFEMLVNIGADGNHEPLRVYAAGYETTVVVGDLAKPYPKEIKRIVRLKRGNNVTGVLRDHTGKPVANGWVFFIPQGHRSNIVEGFTGTDAYRLPTTSRDGAVAEVRTNIDGTFAIPTGPAGTLAASTDEVDLWPFPLPKDGHAELQMPAPSYLVIDLTYWYLDELVNRGKWELSPNSEDPNQCWMQVDGDVYSDPLWKNLEYRRQMLVFAHDPRTKLSKGVTIGQVIEGEMGKALPKGGHNKNLTTKIRIALPPGSYRVQRLRVGPFAPLGEQKVVLTSGKETTMNWARGDGSAVHGKVTWPPNIMFVRQPVEKPRKLDWMVPDVATVYIAPVAGGKTIEAAKIQADGSFFIATHLEPGKYNAQVEIYMPEGDFRGGFRLSDWHESQEFTIPEPVHEPSGSPPVNIEIKMPGGAGGRFVSADAAAELPKVDP